MRTFLNILIICMFIPALSACNTVEGFGKDLQQASRSIQNIGGNSDDDMY